MSAQNASDELPVFVTEDNRAKFIPDPVGPDPTARVYLTGMSLGGDGVWGLAQAYPEKWAAVAPVSSFIQPDVAKVRHIPAWIVQTGLERPASSRPATAARRLFGGETVGLTAVMCLPGRPESRTARLSGCAY